MPKWSLKNAVEKHLFNFKINLWKEVKIQSIYKALFYTLKHLFLYYLLLICNFRGLCHCLLFQLDGKYSLLNICKKHPLKKQFCGPIIHISTILSEGSMNVAGYCEQVTFKCLLFCTPRYGTQVARPAVTYIKTAMLRHRIPP